LTQKPKKIDRLQHVDNKTDIIRVFFWLKQRYCGCIAQPIT